jgi:propanol-preferring alcohol dehydrogenase
MKAAILHRANQPLQLEDIPIPALSEGHTLLRVAACGVCRTDLHIFEGDLPLIHEPLILGHQIVGEILEGETLELPAGTRVGVSWIGGTDGTCPFCRRHEENLCDRPTFTGYSVNGGYAEYALVRSDFIYPLPENLDDTHVAPLLCAGIIGFRSLRVAGTEPGERVGLFGFGASASQAIQVLRHWNCEVFVSTRGENHRRQAAAAGAFWVGKENDKPPVALPSTPSTSTRCPPSITTSSSGASARSAA